jgi:RNA polymerase sigma factor (sigma-70 family)
VSAGILATPGQAGIRSGNPERVPEPYRRVMAPVPRPVDRLTDEALLDALGIGDRDAAEVFVARFQRQVYGVALAVCRDRGLAEEVAQDTFERAWRHAGSYDPRRGSVRTWLLVICRRRAIDHLRVRRPGPLDPATVAGMADLLGPARDRGPDTAAERDEVDRMRARLLGLPREQCRVLLLAGLGGHTAAEVAELEGIPLGTAKTRLRSALRRLRDELGTEERSDA